MPSPYLITLATGDDYSQDLQLTRNGTPIDITGSTFHLTVKKYDTDSDSDAIFIITWSLHTAPLDGLTTINIPANKTALLVDSSYLYDLRVKDSSGKIKTYFKDKIEVVKPILLQVP